MTPRPTYRLKSSNFIKLKSSTYYPPPLFIYEHIKPITPHRGIYNKYLLTYTHTKGLV